MTILATATAGISARYFTLDSKLFLAQQRAVYLAHLTPLLFHISGGILALALGPWQFVPSLRHRHPALHRALGRAYLLSALVAGIGGLLLAPEGLYPPIAPLGFVALGIALLAASALAFVAIRRGDVAAHRIWMLRSYALIFAAVTFRLWLIVLPGFGLPFDQAYRTGAWISWPLNLLVTLPRPLARTSARPQG